RPPDGARTLVYPTTPGRNRLLKEAIIELPFAGRWRLEVDVRRGASAATVSTMVPVESAPSRTLSVWPYLAAPPIAIALFAVGGVLRRTASPPPPCLPPPAWGERE